MENKQTYWQENLRLIAICLVIWFTVSFGFGLLLVEPLNEIRLGGYKLGFWFAQQGSIYTFVAPHLLVLPQNEPARQKVWRRQ